MPTMHANNIELAYEMTGDGPPLLLIAGVGYGGWFWHRLLPALAGRFRVITFDNRGAGESAKPDGPYTVPQMASDSAGLLDALGLRDAFVVGHSLGGFIAQELTLARPDLVGRLVLAATSFGGPQAIPITPEAFDLLTNRRGDPAELVRRGIAVATAPGFAARQPETARALLAYRLTHPVPPAAYAAQVMAGAAFDAAARIGAIRCPTLCLAAEFDRVVPPGNAALLAARIPGARAAILPGVGHIFPIEAPAATAATIVSFADTPD